MNAHRPMDSRGLRRGRHGGGDYDEFGGSQSGVGDPLSSGDEKTGTINRGSQAISTLCVRSNLTRSP